MNVNPNAACIVLEIQRLAAGGTPRTPGSAEAKALALALDACAREAELAALVTLGRKAFAAAAAELAKKPLHGEFDKPHGGPARPGKNRREE